jgi:hypothetical protein
LSKGASAADADKRAYISFQSVGGASGPAARAGATHADYMPGGANAQGGALEDKWAELPSYHRAILKAVQEHSHGEDGVHVGIVAKNVGSEQPQEEIM